jgi:hypothetical protein
MNEVGYDLSGHASKPLNQFNRAEIEVAVTTGRGLPGGSSLARLLAGYRGVRKGARPAKLTRCIADPERSRTDS